MEQLILRDKFKSERYQYSIASDMRNFISMGNGNDANAAWRVDWFLTFEKGTYSPKARLSPLPANSKSGMELPSKDKKHGNSFSCCSIFSSQPA